MWFVLATQQVCHRPDERREIHTSNIIVLAFLESNNRDGEEYHDMMPIRRQDGSLLQ
jgi:hypothetical protein